MIAILNFIRPYSKDIRYTYDGKINDLKGINTRTYLDYVFYSNNHLRPAEAFHEVRFIRADQEWKGITKTSHQDL